MFEDPWPSCTCGPYWSVIPPGPCPQHAPIAWMQADMVRRYRAGLGLGVIKTSNTSWITWPGVTVVNG